MLGSCPRPGAAPIAAMVLILLAVGVVLVHDHSAPDTAGRGRETQSRGALLSTGAHRGVGFDGLFAPPLPALQEAAARIWREYRWIAVPILVVVAIKLLLLRQPLAEVVACILDAVAFLLLHTIEVARFAALELRRLAKELRDVGEGS